jgi:hypothetical protein
MSHFNELSLRMLCLSHINQVNHISFDVPLHECKENTRFSSLFQFMCHYLQSSMPFTANGEHIAFTCVPRKEGDFLRRQRYYIQVPFNWLTSWQRKSLVRNQSNERKIPFVPFMYIMLLSTCQTRIENIKCTTTLPESIFK